MKTIKFRGRAILDSCGEPVNKMVYGDITQGWNKVTMFDWSDGDFYEVDTDSVAQLIGIDKNGNEIYEGDEIKDCFGSSCYANFRHYGGIIDGIYTFVQTRIIN